MLRGMIESASGTIYMAISHLDGAGNISTDLNEAMTRGVSVHAIVRCDSSGHGIVLPDGTSELIRPSGCFGSRLHSKFLLFSNTRIGGRDAQNVVVVGSFTLTSNSIDKHQNSVCIEDEALFQVFRTHWESMKEKAIPKLGLNCADAMGDGSLAVDCSGVEFSSERRVKAYFFPFEESDPVVNVIENFRGRGRDSEEPLARVAMARWSLNRADILEAISRKIEDGVRFRFVLRVHDEDGVHSDNYDAIDSLRTAHPGRVDLFRCSVGGSVDVHSKYVTYKGYYGEGDEWERLVWTGSENWTWPALVTNDEVMLKIRDEEAYTAFAENFRSITELIDG